MNQTKPEQVESLYHAAMSSIRAARDTLQAAYAIAKEEERPALAAALCRLSDEIQAAAFTGFDDDVQNAIDEWTGTAERDAFEKRQADREAADDMALQAWKERDQ